MDEETSNGFTFDVQGYADAVAENPMGRAAFDADRAIIAILTTEPSDVFDPERARLLADVIETLVDSYVAQIKKALDVLVDPKDNGFTVVNDPNQYWNNLCAHPNRWMKYITERFLDRVPRNQQWTFEHLTRVAQRKLLDVWEALRSPSHQLSGYENPATGLQELGKQAQVSAHDLAQHCRRTPAELEIAAMFVEEPQTTIIFVGDTSADSLARSIAGALAEPKELPLISGIDDASALYNAAQGPQFSEWSPKRTKIKKGLFPLGEDFDAAVANFLERQGKIEGSVHPILQAVRDELAEIEDPAEALRLMRQEDVLSSMRDADSYLLHVMGPWRGRCAPKNSWGLDGTS